MPALSASIPMQGWTLHMAPDPLGPELQRCFAFGPFVVRPGRQQLLKDGHPVRIGGRALDILCALVERPGQVVGKRELLDRVWPETFVDEANLKANIVGLRRALGDCADAPQFIATVVGRGYRFIADVRRGEAPRNAVPTVVPGP